MESTAGVEAEGTACLRGAERWVEEKEREDLPAIGGQSEDGWKLSVSQLIGQHFQRERW